MNEEIRSQLNQAEPLVAGGDKTVICSKSSSSGETKDDYYCDGSTGRGRVLPQVLCTVAASVGSFNTGAINAWSGNALTAIADDPQFELKTAASSLIVGLISLGALLGCIGAGKVFDLFGRRNTLMVVSPVMAVGWLIIGLAPNLELICLGRFISGFSTGFVLSGAQIYSSETSESRIRGRLGSLPSFCLTLGVLYAYIITGSFHWRTSAYICTGSSLLLLVTMFFAPETPYWLLMKSRNSEAQQILRKLRGPNYNIDEELKEMENKLLSVGRKVRYSELLKKRSRYPFMVALFMMFLQQTSGAQILMMYTGVILRSANSSLDSRIGTIYTGVAQVVGFLISLTLVDKLERKTLVATSVGSVGTLIIVLASYFLCLQVYDTPWPGWIPATTLMVLVLFYCLGCRSVPWILASELFNTSIRSRANSACVLFNRALNFCIVQVFPFFVEGAGIYTVLFLHGGLAISSAIASLVIIPKTRGKSLEEIQEFFESKAIKNKTPTQSNVTKDSDSNLL